MTTCRHCSSVLSHPRSLYCAPCRRLKRAEATKRYRLKTREAALAGYYSAPPEKVEARNRACREYRQRHPLRWLIVGARCRAKAKGLEFNLTEEGLVGIGYYCPCCGKRFGSTGDRQSSPSLDRINPRGGYTLDNVTIICFRCNSLKRDATYEEIKQIEEWMRADACLR